MKDSIYLAKFRYSDEVLRIDGLINCIEAAKKFVVESGVGYDTVTIFNEDSEKPVYKFTYRKDMFSNKVYWKTYPTLD